MKILVMNWVPQAWVSGFGSAINDGEIGLWQVFKQNLSANHFQYIYNMND